MKLRKKIRQQFWGRGVVIGCLLFLDLTACFAFNTLPWMKGGGAVVRLFFEQTQYEL